MSKTTDNYQKYTLPIRSMTPEAMPQGHPCIPGVNKRSAGTTQMGATIVMLQPGDSGHGHIHPSHESIIFILEGYGVTYMGPDAEPTFQRAGDFLFIPKGVEHVPANLSTTKRFVALTIRADAEPNEAVELVPGYDETIAKITPKLQKQFKEGTLPVDWEKGYQGGEPFVFPWDTLEV
jgi:uncharacterized RmlC-like cupin family protein